MEKRGKRNKYWEQVKIPVVMILLAIFINLGGKLVALNLNIPLYLDTAGTILCALLCGYLPSIFVALVTNFISMVINEKSIYYDAINILIALSTVFITRSGMKRSIKSHMILIATYTFLGGICGGLISIFLNNMSVNVYNNFIIDYFLGKGMPFETGWYISNLFYELIDKTISFSIVLLIFNLVPQRLYYKFDLCLWFQRPMPLQPIIDYEKTKIFKITIRNKIVSVIILFSTFIAIVSVFIYMTLFEGYLVNNNTELAINTSKVASLLIDGDKVEDYLDSISKDNDYYRTEEDLISLIDNTSNCKYIYVYQFKSDGCHVVFDLDSQTETTQALGSVVTFDPNFLPNINDFLNGDETEPVLSKVGGNYTITAYSPIYDSNGKCVSYVAVDIVLENYLKQIMIYFSRYLSVFIGIVIFFISFGIWISKYNIIIPIDSMTLRLNSFEYKDEYDRQQNVEKFKKLEIKTGDEIQGLYENILSLAKENAKYSMENKMKMENIELAKGNMAIILSTIIKYRNYSSVERVEIRKRYVEIVLNKMLELGYYKDILNKSLVNDIVICSPFYNVGKIGIPEDILSKEGNLSQSEEEFLKTHTVIGYNIMSEIMEKLPDASFLAEAKNITHYHHENWDGSGYPDGLKAEKIPISARVMAVAIYYDKLIIGHESEELEFHKAFFELNREASHMFDPLVVDAFIQAKDDIIQVSKESVDKT